MRRLASIAILLVATVQLFAGQIRVTTWNLHWFPSGSPNAAPPEVEARNIQEAAATLREINPDVILLQEIRDAESCEALVAALRPETYSLTICSRFKDEFGNGVGRQQVAIISKKGAFVAASARWKTFGAVDPPRGFAFAVIRYGTNDIAFYCIHLKSNLTRGDTVRQTQLNILKRELASEQVLEHARATALSLSNAFEGIVIGGDFNTTLDQEMFVSEKTLRSLVSAGFESGFEKLLLTERVTIPGKGAYPDATFDYLFIKGVGAGLPRISMSPTSDHRAVTRDISLH